MKIQDLLEKVSEENIPFWDMRNFSLIVRDSKGKALTIHDMKVNAENKTVRITVKESK